MVQMRPAERCERADAARNAAKGMVIDLPRGRVTDGLNVLQVRDQPVNRASTILVSLVGVRGLMPSDDR